MSNKDKKILLLGGSYAQIPAIKAANEKGLYTIICDYLSDNPGKNFADEYINVSTTDKERILEIAINHNVDYVLAYASDPAAPTAAYVSEKLRLPGNSYASVRNLSEKHLFRRLLQEIGLNCPKVLSFEKEEVNELNGFDLEYPLIVKPVDSSGSKGVKLINSFSEFIKAAEYALSYSRSNRIILEEYIEAKGSQLHGDGFVVNGELIFCYLGDHHYNNNVNQFVPYSTTWPSEKTKNELDWIYKDVISLIHSSGFKNGAINIEIRITESDKVYIMEVGPRSGGNFVPQLLKYATDFDMIEAGLNVAIGKSIGTPILKRKVAAYYVIHSENDGILKELLISPVISSYIKEQHQYVKTGEKVNSFQGADAAIGILLMVFPDKHIMYDVISKMDQYIEVKVV